MEKRQGFKLGNDELTLLGKEVKVGDKAPDFQIVTKDLKPCKLADFGDRIKIVSAVPSLDTPVCAIQTVHFNQEADKLGEKVAIITVSVDLPFAQERFCGAKGIKHLTLASDYAQHSFGEAYGCLIEGLALLNRSIFVIDQNNVVQYVEYVEQNENEPNYDAALEAVKKLL